VIFKLEQGEEPWIVEGQSYTGKEMITEQVESRENESFRMVSNHIPLGMIEDN
jgi:hypothetical protein